MPVIDCVANVVNCSAMKYVNLLVLFKKGTTQTANLIYAERKLNIQGHFQAPLNADDSKYKLPQTIQPQLIGLF